MVADLTSSMFPLIRLDVSNGLRARFAGITDYCGFCCHVPANTNPGDPRALLFSLEGEVDVMLRVECGKAESNYASLLQEVYNSIPLADRYSNNLFALYDKVVGAPLRAMVANQRTLRKVGTPVQIGTPPADPAISLVASFGDTIALRQFLCHFAADKDIGSTEVVCVVAKPVYTNEFHATAHYCSRLFNVSLVLVFSRDSLDTVEATNIGASVASAPLLVLADEGVIPCSDTLLGKLKERLNGPSAPAAVCPLPLLFDSSALHYGLQVTSSTELPGFSTVRPRHTQPANASGLVASEALSKACVAIRKSDFDAAGGLDTTFLHADFSWDSLSNRLAASGKTMMVDLDNTLWQRNPGTTPKDGVRSLRDFTYYLDAWAYTGNLQPNKRNASH